MKTKISIQWIGGAVPALVTNVGEYTGNAGLDEALEDGGDLALKIRSIVAAVAKDLDLNRAEPLALCARWSLELDRDGGHAGHSTTRGSAVQAN